LSPDIGLDVFGKIIVKLDLIWTDTKEFRANKGKGCEGSWAHLQAVV
jgi:hypothetical protein